MVRLDCAYGMGRDGRSLAQCDACGMARTAKWHVVALSWPSPRTLVCGLLLLTAWVGPALWMRYRPPILLPSRPAQACAYIPLGLDLSRCRAGLQVDCSSAAIAQRARSSTCRKVYA
jgi:hypothetical protein